ncbi:MAG: tRNA 2-thiouridine(34) synthase MnmA [Phycisphaerales bacterium]|nr:tRNA 2-thiouridine(34) synthase MnmA [Phycisphaerales bacterium]
MSRNGKIVVAMSGGVDSSVVACMLKDQGYEPIGVFMRVGAEPIEPACAVPAAAPARRLKHGCCSATDAMDARAIAARLGIPFYALNFRAEFDRIIDYFVDEYANARTPNPCVMCNIHLKFGRLFEYADMVDAQAVATGHYARIVERNGQSRLAQAANLAKDQSYVLFGIRRDDLARCVFPLGDVEDKGVVRKMATDLGLSVSDKADSQEICFVPGGDYRKLVRERRPEAVRPGEVVSEAGETLGAHDGVVGFTIGQRRGLGIAAGAPIYVTRLDVLNNTVTVGDRAALHAAGLVADRANWHIDPPTETVSCRARIRHLHRATPALLMAMDDGPFEVRFETPQPAVTPGQAVVAYDAEGVVIGGGWIQRAIR